MEWLRFGRLFDKRMLAPDAGGGEGGGAGAPAAGDGAGAEGGVPGPSFDDLLKEKEHQAEFDRRVNKALDTARGKWEQDKEAAVAAARTEAEKLAKMSAEDKARHAQETREKALADKEAAVTRRELRAQALEALAEKGLPKELAGLLVYTDADACGASLASVEGVFREAVQAAVVERMKGTTPGAGGGSDKGGGRASLGIASALGKEAARASGQTNDVLKKYMGG